MLKDERSLQRYGKAVKKLQKFIPRFVLIAFRLNSINIHPLPAIRIIIRKAIPCF
jgi:hypothetical protein